MLRILDLYSGIGGFSKAFEDVSSEHFKTHAFCEIDKYAQLVLKKHWPLTPIFEDVRTIPGKMFRHRIEIICGGFPCQDISVAGKQRGINEETRSGLWFEYKRLIEEIKPRWVVIENVANLRSNGLAVVLKDLSEIGYDAEWEIISARSVGAPHLRERIWIVAYPSNTQSLGLQRLQADREQVTSSHGEERLSVCGGKINTAGDINSKSDAVTNTNDFRFWPTFATEEEKQFWWAKATVKFRNWWETEPDICRVDDGLPQELDKVRSQRIKQLGNSIVPPIVEIIAKRILELELEAK